MSIGGPVIGFKLTLVNGETVVLGSEVITDQVGLFSWGEPEQVLERAARRGFLPVSESGMPTGLNGGVGAINYPWPAILKIEILRG